MPTGRWYPEIALRTNTDAAAKSSPQPRMPICPRISSFWLQSGICQKAFYRFVGWGDDFATASTFVLSLISVDQHPVGMMKEKTSHTIFHSSLHDRVLASDGALAVRSGLELAHFGSNLG